MLPPSDFIAAFCVICQQEEHRERLVKVKSRGLISLIKYKESKACEELKEYLVKEVDQQFS